MVDSLGSLLSKSWAFCRAQFVPILLGALVAGAVSLVLTLSIVNKMSQGANNALNRLGVDRGRLEDLQRRAQQGDQQATQELQQEVQRTLGNFSEKDLQNLGGAFAGDMARTFFSPYSLLLILGMIIVSFAFQGYILVLLLEKKPAQEAFARTASLILPLIGLSLWTALRTFIWIPIIGIIPFIILAPRFVLAPVLLVRDGKGVLESTRISYRRTAGYWGKIVGNVIVAVILVGIAAAAINAIFNAILGMSLASYLTPFVQMVTGAFTGVFIGYLGLTILGSKQSA